MNDLELMKRAKDYMDKLANGIDPISGKEAPDEDIINNVRLSRCFFYVSGLLQRLIENEGEISSRPAKRAPKQPFSINASAREAFAYSDTPISVSEIAKRINALAEGENAETLKYTAISAWLVETGLLYVADMGEGRSSRRPTGEGERMGIRVERRSSPNGEYEAVVYTESAQRFIVDNLEAILEAMSRRYCMEGKPWTPEQDSALRDMLRRNISTEDISTALRRKPGSVKSRIKSMQLY